MSYRNEDIVIEENMSVSLKVTTSFSYCRWICRGLVPIQDKIYLNTKTHTLRILKPGIDVDGCEYSCEIRKNNDGFIKISPVTLRVKCPNLDELKDSLSSIYLDKPEVPEESWPPVSNQTYINLALIKQQTINYGGECAYFTIKRDVEAVLHDKEIIKYENIFDGLRSGSLLLIEGRPGCGKTTFVHKISRDWAASEVQGPRRLMLLVSLRTLNNWSKPISLVDLLQLFDLEGIEKVLKDRKGKGFCFVFDGLDEFSPTDGKKSVVYKIISKEYLPQSLVIVASRPAALVRLRRKAHKIIEVIGFRRDLIFKYIESYPFSRESKVEDLKGYLLHHPNILHMCYLPIHAAMISFLFEVIGKIPRTESEMYNHFTRFSLMRSFTKHKEEDLEDVNVENLSGEERDLFENICKLGLEMTLQNKQVIDEEDVMVHLKAKDSIDTSLGVITVDRTAGLKGFKNIYTFLHLTYQEYLAALHISTLSHVKQHGLIEQHVSNEHMQVVWKFYCGLVKIEEYKYQIKALFSGKKEIFLYDLHCAYESQQKEFCDFLIEHMKGQVMISNKYLTTMHLVISWQILLNQHQCHFSGAKLIIRE